MHSTLIVLIAMICGFGLGFSFSLFFIKPKKLMVERVELRVGGKIIDEINIPINS